MTKTERQILENQRAIMQALAATQQVRGQGHVEELKDCVAETDALLAKEAK